MWSRFNLGTGPQSDEPSGEPTPDGGVFRILLIGDFSGRKSRGAHDPRRASTAKPVEVDRDNWEKVLGKIQPSLLVSFGQQEAVRFSLTFKELDDFHPDRIFTQMDLFSTMRQTRSRLQDHRTFNQAAAEVRSWARSAAPAPAAPSLPPPSSLEGEGSLLEQMLNERLPDASAPPRPGDSAIGRLIQEVVGPYVIPGADPDRDQLVKAVDDASADQMRSLLHHPDFQALEAAWRSVYFLVRRMSDEHQVKLFLLDLTQEELAKDLAGDELARSGAYGTIVERTVKTPGGIPWGAVVGLHAFSPTLNEVELLHRVGAICAAGKAAFLAGASPKFLGVDDLAGAAHPRDWAPIADPEGRELWELLRAQPHAANICLTLPRFLLRLPYGREHDVIESFEFEEIDESQPVRRSLLWGSGAVLVAHLLGEAFAHGGLEALPSGASNIDGLPSFVYEEDGDREMFPCGEVLLVEDAIEAIVPRGLTPVVSFRRQDRVQVAPINGVGGQPLQGQWGS